MILQWVVASLHLIALALGASAIHSRARFLGSARRPSDLRPALVADNLWGLAAVLWLGTGVWRAVGNLEKGLDYYLGHPLFHAKLTLFLVVVFLEIRPMMTLIRWRRSLKRGGEVDLAPAGALARISYLQLALVLVIVVLAAAVARNLRFS